MRQTQELKRSEIRRLFRAPENRGVQSALARELGISHPAISLWLKGRCKSHRIEAAAQAKAREILERGTGGQRDGADLPTAIDQAGAA